MAIIEEEKKTEMQIEVNMEEATSLAREMEEALSSVLNEKSYSLIIIALEILQIELMMNSMNKVTQEELNKDRLSREELTALIKKLISDLLLGVTKETLSITEFIIIQKKELH